MKWTISSIGQAIDECDLLYSRLLPELAEDLNVYHSLQWRREQYELLLGNWLLQFIQILYDRWHDCDDNSQLSGEFFAPQLTGNLEQFSDYWKLDTLNANLYRQISWIKGGRSLSVSELPTTTRCSQGFRLMTKGDAPILAHAQIYDPLANPWVRRWRHFRCYSLLRDLIQPGSLTLGSPERIVVDKKWRVTSGWKSEDLFKQMMRAMVYLHLPAAFLEGFKSLRQIATKIPPKALSTATSIHENTPFKFLAAEWQSKFPLICHQHGGGFGLDQYCMPESYERAVSNYFFTWGWKEDEQTIPLPAPPRMKTNRIRGTRGVLLKLDFVPRYRFRFGHEQRADTMSELIKDTCIFIGGLCHLDLEVSDFPIDLGWDTRGRFQAAGLFPPEQRRRVETYAIHSYNCLHTGWIESLAANLPVVCFMNKRVNVFRDSAQPYIDELESVGIVHSSPESAVEKILEIYDDPRGWWETCEVQEARDNFVKRFARLEVDWLDAWRDNYEKIVAEL